MIYWNFAKTARNIQATTIANISCITQIKPPKKHLAWKMLYLDRGGLLPSHLEDSHQKFSFKAVVLKFISFGWCHILAQRKHIYQYLHGSMVWGQHMLALNC